VDTQGWSVSWVSPETGVSSKLDLDKASELPFDTGLPTRTPQAHKGQKAKPGLLWSSTTKAHLLYLGYLHNHSDFIGKPQVVAGVYTHQT